MRLRDLATLAFAASCALGLISCGKHDSTMVPAATMPSKILKGVRISGPPSVAPGATVQLSALASYTDGSTEDVTARTHWESSGRLVLSVSSSGAATGNKSGEATIFAVYNNFLPQSFSMLVLPAGTYRLSGTVVESGLPVRDATIDVTAGQGTGLSTTSDYAGTYKLYGVAGNVEVRASKAAYGPQSRALVVMENAVADFQLTTVNPEVSVAGPYLLTVTASGACTTGGTQPLPAEARQRHYTAVITQDAQHPTVLVTLGGAKFAVNGGSGNSFSGRVEPDRVTFLIRGFDFYYYYLAAPFDLVEALDDGRFVIIEGGVTTTPSGPNLVGTLDGTIAVTKDTSGDYRATVGQCYSTTHQFTLTRNSAVAGVRIRR